MTSGVRAKAESAVSGGRQRVAARLALPLAGREDWAATLLAGLATDGAHGCVMVERLRFGPPETWAGWHPAHGRVALKVWPRAGEVPTRLAAGLALRHAGVAPLLAVGEAWAVWGWGEGETLRPPVSPAVVDAIAAALAALHDAGLAHGDLKPANIVVAAGRPVLIDWGEDGAGTPGWRPAAAHSARSRDLWALERLYGLVGSQ